MKDFPRHWRRLTTVDAHTGGEPFRVVTGGVPELVGATILERRRWAREHLDGWRRALMWEPRGHADMYGCLLTAPVTPGADLGVVFLHNEGYSTMCGHGVIALVKVALEIGLLPAAEPETRVTLDTPAGPVAAWAEVDGGRVGRVRFHNVPSFVVELGAEVDVPGLGRLRYDLAYGGAFYACVAAADAAVACEGAYFRRLIEKGTTIKRAVMAARPIEHPVEEDLGFLYGVIFVEPSPSPGVHSRNVCVFADGEVDRSPTGTGLSGRLAIHHARGEIGVGEAITIESLVGSRFTGRIVETTRLGPYDAVIPEIEGSAHLTGRSELVIDPDDPLAEGFLLR